MDVAWSGWQNLNDFKFNLHMTFRRNFILEANYFKLCFQILETMPLPSPRRVLQVEEFEKLRPTPLNRFGPVYAGLWFFVKLDLSSQVPD